MIDQWRSLSNATMKHQLIRVVVADDHPVVRSGVVFELAHHPDIEVV